MNKVDKTVKKMKKFTKDVISSKETSRDFLIKVGVYNSDGTLNKNYK